jgi:3-phenylpropionate/cinnamic acid dioxygenase small subunit
MDLCQKQQGYPVLTEYIIKNKKDWGALQKQGLVQVQTTTSAFSFDKIMTGKRIIKIDPNQKSTKGVDSKNKELKVIGMIKTLRVKGDIAQLKRNSLKMFELGQKKT